MAIQFSKSDYDILQKMSGGRTEDIVKGARERGVSDEDIYQGLMNKVSSWKESQPKEQQKEFVIDPEPETRSDRNMERTLAATSGALSGFTMGLSDLAISGIDKLAGTNATERIKEARKEHPGYALGGEMASFIAPGGAANLAVKGGGKLAKLATGKITNKTGAWLADKAIKGGVLGAEAFAQHKMEQLAETRDWEKGATFASEAGNLAGEVAMYAATDIALGGLGRGVGAVAKGIKENIGTKARAIKLAGGKENLVKAQQAASDTLSSGGNQKDAVGAFYRSLAGNMDNAQIRDFEATIMKSPKLQAKLYDQLASKGASSVSKLGESMKGAEFNADIAGDIDKFLGSEYMNSYGAKQIGLGSDSLEAYMGVGTSKFGQVKKLGKLQAQQKFDAIPNVVKGKTKKIIDDTIELDQELKSKIIDSADRKHFENFTSLNEAGEPTAQKAGLDKFLADTEQAVVAQSLKAQIKADKDLYGIYLSAGLEDLLDNPKTTVGEVINILKENISKVAPASPKEAVMKGNQALMDFDTVAGDDTAQLVISRVQQIADNEKSLFKRDKEGLYAKSYIQEYVRNMLHNGSANVQDIMDLKELVAASAKGMEAKGGLSTTAGTFDKLINREVLGPASNVLDGSINAMANYDKVEAMRKLGEKINLKSLSSATAEIDKALDLAGTNQEKAVLLTGFTLGLRKRLAEAAIAGDEKTVFNLIDAMDDKARLGRYISNSTKNRVLEDTKKLANESKVLYQWQNATGFATADNPVLTAGIRTGTAFFGGARVAAQNAMITGVKNLGFGPRAMKQIMTWAENPTSDNFLRMVKSTAGDTIERNNMQKALKIYYDAAKKWLMENPNEYTTALIQRNNAQQQ